MMKIKKSFGAALVLLAGLALAGAVAAQDKAKAKADAPESANGGYSEEGADTCLGCHEADHTSREGAIFLSRHARPDDARTPFGKGQLQCEACHGPGDAHVNAEDDERGKIIAFNPPASRPAGQLNAPCLVCHGNKARIAWQGSTHDVNQVSCATCHSLHSANDPVLAAATQADVCAKCHKKQMAEIRKPWSHPILAGKVVCSDCHNVHGSNVDKLLVKPTVNQVCYSCHAEKRGPFLWEHQPVAEDCANCHSPHGSTNPALLKKSPPLLCQQCHAAAGHPAIARTGAALPGGTGGGQGFLLAGGCVNCHSRVHGSNHPAGAKLMR